MSRPTLHVSVVIARRTMRRHDWRCSARSKRPRASSSSRRRRLNRCSSASGTRREDLRAPPSIQSRRPRAGARAWTDRCNHHRLEPCSIACTLGSVPRSPFLGVSSSHASAHGIPVPGSVDAHDAVSVLAQTRVLLDRREPRTAAATDTSRQRRTVTHHERRHADPPRGGEGARGDALHESKYGAASCFLPKPRSARAMR